MLPNQRRRAHAAAFEVLRQVHVFHSHSIVAGGLLLTS